MKNLFDFNFSGDGVDEDDLVEAALAAVGVCGGDPNFPPGMTLESAGQTLRRLAAAEKVVKRKRDSVRCPLCHRIVKVYPQALDAAMAATLVRLLTASTTDFVHAPSLAGDNHKVSQLAWWGFVEELMERRPDGGRAGYWRITPAGVEFASGRSRAHRNALIFQAECFGLCGPLVGVREALGDRFDLDELLRS